MVFTAEGWEPFFDEETGGFFYSRCPDSGMQGAPHSEITGYFLWLASRGSGALGADERLISDAAAAFLRAVQADCGAFPHSAGPAARMGEWHVFDSGIAAMGLLEHARQSGQEGSRVAALRALDWVDGAWRAAGGGYHAAWCQAERRWLDAERASYWSGTGGCYHGKLLIPLLAAGRDASADRLIDWLLGLQCADGSFPASDVVGTTHSHAMCYALEGLAAAAHARGDGELWHAAERGLRWLSGRAVESDGLLDWLPGGDRYRVDSQLQFVRLARICGLEEELRGGVAACVRRLESMRAGQQPPELFHPPKADGTRMVAAWPLVFGESLARVAFRDCGWLI